MVRIQHRLRVVALAALVAGSPAFARAEPGEIKGQDVMGDKTKSANDGWSQAPVPREESAGKDAPNPGGDSMSNKSESPGSKEGGKDGAKDGAKDAAKGSAMGNGPDDPQKPLDQRAPGPSGSNPAAPSK